MARGARAGAPERGRDVSSFTLRRYDSAEPAATYSAARARPQVVALLILAAALAWWWTVRRMAGMDAGPSAELGSLGWFAGVWAVMMAAMMLPSLAPTAALYAALARRREPELPLLFAAGYLLLWALAGVGAYALLALGRDAFAAELAWSAGGRWLAAGVLALAGAYELTPLKAACLTRCRSPQLLLGRASREGRKGALAAGVRSGGACLGCSWALMAALFALGVMSLTWMALVAGLVALEKLVPWRRAAVAATAAVLFALAATMLIAPHEVPGLVVPGHGAMQATREMAASGLAWA